MTLTIDIPEKVVEHAASLGVPVDTLVTQAIHDIDDDSIPSGFERLGPPTMTPAEAGAKIRELASHYTLGGLKIKDLIEEGRR